MIKLARWCLQTDCTRRPSIALLKVLEGSIDVDTNIDYSFINPIPQVSDASLCPSASVLSGGRCSIVFRK